MDFGLAKLLDSEALKKVTVTGTEFAVGTPGYICPEQARGEEMDHRGDLYSVGIILFELLTGRLPFSGATMDVMLAHATEMPPSFAGVGAAGLVPSGIEQVVLECLAKDAADRPSCARDLAERFETALAHEQALQEAALPAGYPDPGDRVAVAATCIAQPVLARSVDPHATIHHLEAWMPEQIATYKLRGFVQDAGGDVIESVPGLIRVRLGGKGSTYADLPRGTLSWLGIGRKPTLIDMELRLERAAMERDSLLNITVVLRPTNKEVANTPEWRERCSQIYCDLRAYVMGRQ
jgi:serine/threonine-protein kinase